MSSDSNDPTTSTVPLPVFVTGIGRSGTSALLKCLGQHKDFVAPKAFGEAPFIDNFARFLRNYEDEDSLRNYNLASYKVDAAERYRIFAEMIFRLHSVPVDSGRAQQALYWAAKTSLRAATFDKFHSIFGDFKVIYIIRNGIEVVNSSRHFAGFKSLEFAGLCQRWKTSLESNRFLEAAQNCAVIRHQELVADPAGTLAGAFLRVGLPQDAGPAEFIAQNVFNSSFSAESKDVESKDAFRTRLSDAWNKWTGEEQEVFLALCGEEMARYGFEIPGSRAGGEWAQAKPPLTSDTADAGMPAAARAQLPKGFSPIADFGGDDVSAGAIRIAPEAIAGREFNEPGNSRIEIENRIGIAAASYCLHPAPSVGLLYTEVPKVACTTLKFLMQSIETEAQGGSPRDFNRKLIHNRTQSPLPAIKQMTQPQFDEVIEGKSYFRFSVVRNPFERILSCYLSKIARPMPQRARIQSIRQGIPLEAASHLTEAVSFKEFLETIATQSIRDMDIHWRPQADQLLLGVVKYDFIGRYERLGDCLGYLKARFFPKSAVMIPGASNATNSASLLHQHYDAGCIELVRNIYADDFAILGYDNNLEAAAIDGPARAVA